LRFKCFFIGLFYRLLDLFPGLFNLLAGLLDRFINLRPAFSAPLSISLPVRSIGPSFLQPDTPAASAAATSPPATPVAPAR